MKQVIYYIYQFNQALRKYYDCTDETLPRLGALEDVKRLLNKRAPIIQDLVLISENIKEAIKAVEDLNEEVPLRMQREFADLCEERSRLVDACIEQDLTIWRLARKMERGQFIDVTDSLKEILSLEELKRVA